MASVFRRTKKYPLPAGAVVNPRTIDAPKKHRRSKAFISWKGPRGATLEGRLSDDESMVVTNVATWTDGSSKKSSPASIDGLSILKPSGPYYATWKNHLGRRQTKCVGTTDKATAEQYAAKMEADAIKYRDGLLDGDAIEALAAMRKPLLDHIAHYKLKLESANRSARYIRETVATLKRTATSCGINTAADISSSKLEAEASKLFGARKSSRTVQSMLSTWKSFTSWLLSERQLVRDPLHLVEKPSAESKRKYRRRMLLPDEWQVMQTVTNSEPVRFGMSGPDRALLYRVAIQTGYRAKELKSVLASNVVMRDGTSFIYLRGVNTKNGKPAKQYIDANLASDLQAHIAGRKKKSLFDLPHCSNLARMIRLDLAAARSAWLQAANGSPDEVGKRESSDFLCVKNDDDEVFDFHALRHTCGAWLASTGTDPKIVQSVMRHSTITLTFDLYGHLFPGAEENAAGKLGAMIDRAVWEPPATILNAEPIQPAQRQVQQTDSEILQTDASQCDSTQAEALIEEAPKSNQIADLGDVLQASATTCESAPSWTRTMNLLIKSQLLCQLS